MTADPRERRCQARAGRTSMLRFALLSLLLLQAASAAASRFDSSRAWEHLRQLVAQGPRPAGSAAIEESREVHQERAGRRRRVRRRTGVGRADAARAGPHGQSGGDHSGRPPRPPGDRRPLRHQAVAPVPLRRRQRRRLERGLSHRAGAGPQGAEERRSRSSCCSSTARKPWSNGRHRPHLRQPYCRRHGAQDRHAGVAEGDDAGRHDRATAICGSGATTTPPPWLTDIVWDAARRQKLVGALPRRAHPDRRRPPAVRQGRRSRRSTSSTSTTRRGTRPPTRWTPSAPAACRSSATCCWRRCRKSRRGWRSPDSRRSQSQRLQRRAPLDVPPAVSGSSRWPVAVHDGLSRV